VLKKRKEEALPLEGWR